MVKRILVVEREKSLAQFLSLELQQEGYLVHLAKTGSEALQITRDYPYDLILLNDVLEDMIGTDFARRLSEHRPASVLIVLDDPEHLETHVDDIQRFAVASISKPVLIDYLLEKISAIFRGRDFIDQHCSQMKMSTSCRNLRIDTESHMVYRGDESIVLTRREYDLLATLMTSHTVLSREQLLARVWKYESTTETNVVDVYIRYLRGKIDIAGQKSYIKTVRGVGYTMQD